MTALLQQKIKQARDQAKGHAKEAEKLLLTWARQEPGLLQALVEPFLPGIIAHALNHGASTPQPSGKTLKAGKISSVGMDGLVEQLSSNIGHTPSSIGDEKTIRTKASSRHEDAIRTLARAHKESKKKD